MRRSEDTFSLQMVDAAGQLHLWTSYRSASLTVENKSLMPDDFATRLARDQASWRTARAAGAQSSGDRRAARGARRADLRSPDQVRRRASQLADMLGQLPGDALFAARPDQHRQRPTAAPAWTFPLIGGTVMEAPRWSSTA